MANYSFVSLEINNVTAKKLTLKRAIAPQGTWKIAPPESIEPKTYGTALFEILPGDNTGLIEFHDSVMDVKIMLEATETVRSGSQTNANRISFSSGSSSYKCVSQCEITAGTRHLAVWIVPAVEETSRS